MTKPGQRKVRVGVVTSNRMNKTIIVRVERVERHPRYGKYVRRWTNLWAHDDTGLTQVGDKVRVIETLPLSKKKRWRLLDIIEGGRAPVLGAETTPILSQDTEQSQGQAIARGDV
jgi:small subunit ribosomal protein S17